MSKPKVSVIIPLHIYGERFKNEFPRYLELDYSNYEVIVVSDFPVDLNYPDVKVIYTQKSSTGPAEKRDIALVHCTGEISAFIDDDAFPDKNWLKNAVKHFSEPEVGAVGGPGVIPENDSLMQKAGGAVYSSILGSGKNIYRFTPKKSREVDDYPAYNLLIRKSILQKVGGFGSTFYGGEDTKVCLSIINLGKKIIYDPKVVVYHHRRPLFIQHLKQINNVGIHRGYFVKKYSETSRRFFYFLPSIITIILGLAVILAFFFKPLGITLLTILGVWFFLGFISVLFTSKDIRIALLAALGIIATHLTYGTAFLRGLTLKELKR